MFRGTATPRDAMADLDPHMGFYPNPVATAVAGKDKSTQKQDEKIGVHLGFASKFVINGCDCFWMSPICPIHISLSHNLLVL